MLYNISPGPDDIPPEVLKLILGVNPRITFSIYNAWLTEGIFYSYSA